jgi:hypothetical protein
MPRNALLRSLPFVALFLSLTLLRPPRVAAAESAEGWCWMCVAWYGQVTVDHDGDLVMLKECKLQLTPFPGVWCYYE